MGVLAFIGIIIVVTVIGICVIVIKEAYNIAISIVLLIIAVIGLSFIMAYISNTPTALDVYKGKTELRITYDGKVPVDSVVIYKKGCEQ